MPRFKAALGLAAGISLSVLAMSAQAKREKPLTSVADLRYGAALYNYYLDDYMAALTELLIAEERGGIQGHGDNPEIMEGGLAMGYSMERYASEIFDRLLEQNRSVEARDAAWFYLAKLRYSHGEWARAEEALNKISEKPVKKLREDVVALRINVVLKQDRPVEAAALLNDNRVAERWVPYFNFNIGSAFARTGDYQSAVGFFEYFAYEEFLKEEHRALYDKAMTAAGFAYLFLKDYAQAKEFFSRVRLDSKLKNRALLGYGWAAVELGDYNEALKPWLHLANSPIIDENNQEALIAVPYAYEKMGAEALALEHYQKAESSFLEEIKKIDGVLASIQNEDLLTALKVDARGKLDWMTIAEEKQLSPRLTYLVRLFSQDRFQASIYELQDLLAIRDDLVEWQDKIAFYSDMVDSREAFRVEQGEILQISELKTKIEKMKAERAAYSQSLERIASEKDFFALATEEEQDLIKRAKRSLDNVELLRESDPFIDEYEESARRYHGLLLWQASETYSDRLWQAIKGLNKLDKALAETTDLESRVNVLMSQAPDLNPYRDKMDEANAKVLDLNARIDAAISRSEVDLRDEVSEILQSQKIRLLNYLAQSRLSVARIYDKARNAHEEAEFEQLKQEAEAAKAAKEASETQTTPSSPSAAPDSAVPTLGGPKLEEPKLDEPELDVPEQEQASQKTELDALEAEIEADLKRREAEALQESDSDNAGEVSDE